MMKTMLKTWYSYFHVLFNHKQKKATFIKYPKHLLGPKSRNEMQFPINPIEMMGFLFNGYNKHNVLKFDKYVRWTFSLFYSHYIYHVMTVKPIIFVGFKGNCISFLDVGPSKINTKIQISVKSWRIHIMHYEDISLNELGFLSSHSGTHDFKGFVSIIRKLKV